MKEIRGTVADDVYEMFQAFKKIRRDRKPNGPALEKLILEKYKREKESFDEAIQEMREGK
jgi:predicted CopG family antitoxin